MSALDSKQTDNLRWFASGEADRTWKLDSGLHVDLADVLDTVESLRAALADRDRELQQAAAENAVMREAATKLRDKGDHADFCEWDQVDENDGCPISCSCGHNDVIAALSTPSPRAAQILAALDAARLAYAVPNPTATGADLEALTDLGRKLAALVSP